MINDLKAVIEGLSDEFAAYKLHTNKVISDLTNECKQLLEDNRKLHEKIDALSISGVSNVTLTPASPDVQIPTFADMVKDSVKTAFRDEKSKREVIINSVEEKGNDEAIVADLCEKFQFPTKPAEVIRIGRKNTATQLTSNRHRLLKVSFPSPFDARAFCSRYEGAKKMMKTLQSSVSEWDEQKRSKQFSRRIKP